MTAREIVSSMMVVVALFCASSANGNVFDLPNGQTSLRTVLIGDPGNAADTRRETTFVFPPDSRQQGDVGTLGAGSVAVAFYMGKYEVTTSQYTAFLNAVADTDAYGLYNTAMAGSKACGILRTGTTGSYQYSVAANCANRPVNYVSWGDAARFANWLHNGQPNTGVQDSTTTETGAYALNGAISRTALMAVTRSSNAQWFIPTDNEWYKAAYYKGGSASAGYWTYPYRSNSTPPRSYMNYLGYYDFEMDPGNPGPSDNGLMPVGSFPSVTSAYGTCDQGGNVAEWVQSVLFTNYRAVRGGSHISSWAYGRDPDVGEADDALAANFVDWFDPTQDVADVGFRVAGMSAGVPEPGSACLLSLGAACALAYAWRRRRTE